MLFSVSTVTLNALQSEPDKSYCSPTQSTSYNKQTYSQQQASGISFIFTAYAAKIDR